MQKVAQRIRFCRSRDGTPIAYAICGDGHPLVWVQHWIHHLQLDWDSLIWRPWLAWLTRRHTVIRYDWRGCGLSDRGPGKFSIESYSADLEAVVEATGVERFALFGMAGAGSGIAMRFAVHHPERVACLVLQECHMRGRIAGGATTEQREEAQARLKVIELGWPNDTPAYGRFFTALHIPDANAAQMREYNNLLRQTTSPNNAVQLLRTFWEADFSEVAPQVRCPTVVIHARGDSVIPFTEGRDVAARIAGARFMPLDSQNHLLLETEPAWSPFVGVLDEFLAATLPDQSISSVDELTARERDILELLAQGKNNGGIAARLKISEKTVRNHVSAIFSKLEVNSRAQAIVVAREAGFGARGGARMRT
jgi:pimeloyl-ACP methyl ester carboxylesterase/DNA-binding CsgD family transcriptional regulator